MTKYTEKQKNERLTALKSLYRTTEKETGLLKFLNKEIKKMGYSTKIRYIDMPDEGGSSAGVIRTFKQMAERENLKTELINAGVLGRYIIAYEEGKLNQKIRNLIVEASGE